MLTPGQRVSIRDDNLEEKAFKRYKRSQEKGEYTITHALSSQAER